MSSVIASNSMIFQEALVKDTVIQLKAKAAKAEELKPGRSTRPAAQVLLLSHEAELCS